MKSAQMHPDEILRLQSLKSTNLLDTPPEGKFDFITQTALDLCDTKIALISLVDVDRQWFKSKIGLSVCETHRDIAFCSHAILQNDIFEVQDTLKDERFFDNPLVLQDPHIRFYAGAPIFWKERMPIGTLCVIDTVPKILTESQKNLLRKLADSVAKVIEIKDEMRSIDTELKVLKNKKIMNEKKRNDLLLETKVIRKNIYK